MKKLIYVIPIMFIIIGSSFIHEFNNQKEVLPLERYSFSIYETHKNSGSLNVFNLLLNFQEDFGKIKFVPSNKVEGLSIEFPFNITKDDLELNVTNSEGEKIIFIYNNSRFNEPNYIIYNNNQIILDNIPPTSNFEIKFSNLVIEPNAIFYWHPSNLNISQSNSAFDIILGENYECIGFCYLNGRATEELFYHSSPTHLKIGLAEASTSYVFKITTRYKKAEENKNKYLAWGIALVLSGITLLFSFLYSFLFDKENNNLLKNELNEKVTNLNNSINNKLDTHTNFIKENNLYLNKEIISLKEKIKEFLSNLRNKSK